MISRLSKTLNIKINLDFDTSVGEISSEKQSK